MTTVFNKDEIDPHTSKYWAMLESALMAKAISSTADLPPERRKALLRLWSMGTFEAAAAGIEIPAGCGLLQWQEEGTLRHLTYHSPTGLVCPLGRVYLQPDGTWAALVVAGVRQEEHEAMATAEWAISRLTAE